MSARGETPASRDAAVELLAKYGVLVAFVVMVVCFSVVRPETFPTADNLKAILTIAAPSAVVALGVTVPLVMNDFDLSFGAMIGLAGGAAVMVMTKGGAGWEVAVLIGIACGLVGGLVNGILVAYLGGSSFIITLAMGTVFTGLEFAITDQVTVFSGTADGYQSIAQGTLLGFSNTVWIALGAGLILWTLLDRSEIGRYMYAVGGNSEAARLSGLPIKRLRLAGFVIASLGGALAAILLTSTSGSYTPALGGSYLLPAYAAAFLGAAVFRPGEFNIPGTLLGVVFLGTIQTGLTMLNLETYIINLVQGAVLVTAVLLSRLGKRAAT